AGREIERHRGAIALWRRRAVERKEHLLLVHGRDNAAPSRAPANPAGAIGTLRTRIQAALAGARHIVAQWRRRVRVRKELTTLTARDLKDLNWTDIDVLREIRKPFWRP